MLFLSEYDSIAPVNGSDWLHGVIGERHTGYVHNRILPVGP